MPASDTNTEHRGTLHQLAGAMLYFGIATAVIGTALLFNSLSLFLNDGSLSIAVMRGVLALVLGLSGIVWILCSTRFRKLSQKDDYSIDDLVSVIKTLSFSFLVLAILASLRVAAQSTTTFGLILSW